MGVVSVILMIVVVVIVCVCVGFFLLSLPLIPYNLGIVEPIRPMQNISTLGLGKVSEDQHYAEVAAQKRKAMDTELEETPELKQQREVYLLL